MFELKYLAPANSRAALLSVRQVAQLLGLSTATVYRLCENRDLVHVRIGNTIRVAITDLVGFVGRQTERRRMQNRMRESSPSHATHVSPGTSSTKRASPASTRETP